MPRCKQLLPLILAIFLAGGPCPVAPAFAADWLDAVVRVACFTGGQGDVGTGFVSGCEAGTVYVVTNAHVVTTQSPTVTFFVRGHESRQIPASVIYRSAADPNSVDVCVLSVAETSLGGVRIDPLSWTTRELNRGDTVQTLGCPGASWPSCYRGHVTASDGRYVEFRPIPAQGRSGSPLLDVDGRVCGLIAWQTGGDGGQPTAGRAMSAALVLSHLQGTRNEGQGARPASHFAGTQGPGTKCAVSLLGPNADFPEITTLDPQPSTFDPICSHGCRRSRCPTCGRRFGLLARLFNCPPGSPSWGAPYAPGQGQPYQPYQTPPNAPSQLLPPGGPFVPGWGSGGGAEDSGNPFPTMPADQKPGTDQGQGTSLDPSQLQPAANDDSALRDELQRRIDELEAVDRQLEQELQQTDQGYRAADESLRQRLTSTIDQIDKLGHGQAGLADRLGGLGGRLVGLQTWSQVAVALGASGPIGAGIWAAGWMIGRGRQRRRRNRGASGVAPQVGFQQPPPAATAAGRGDRVAAAAASSDPNNPFSKRAG